MININKTVLITGASRGIGAATAQLLATQGYNIAINYVNNDKAANKLLDTLLSSGANAALFKADVSDENAVVDMFNDIDNTLGPVTHLVNNVGILFTQMSVLDMSAERINQVLSTNVTSYFLCSREAVKRMLHADQNINCAIVNVSSAASRTGSPNEYTDYAASKGAVDSFTRGLSKELAANNIRVNCVRPGCIETDIHADGGEPARVSRLAPNIPLQRGGQPNEIATAIAWLLSDEASYATGSFIDLAGGN